MNICDLSMGGMVRGIGKPLHRATRPEFKRVAPSHPRIVSRSDVWGGKAVVKGTRIPVFMIYARLQSGWSEQDVRESYPRLTSADIGAVVAYAQAFPDRVQADRDAYERSLPQASS